MESILEALYKMKGKRILSPDYSSQKNYTG